MEAEYPLDMLFRGFKRNRTLPPVQKLGVWGRWAGFEESCGLGDWEKLMSEEIGPDRVVSHSGRVPGPGRQGEL